MDVEVFARMFGYGVAAFDPVGVAAMPILLLQPRGIRRSWVFISGSAVALMLMGFAVALGLGGPLVEFSRRFPWLDDAIELGAGVVLVLLGGYFLLRARAANDNTNPESITSDSFRKRLSLPLAMLFAFGFILVIVQSIVDVVFLLAMVDMGQERLGMLATALAVAIYTVAALLIQILVVVAFQRLSPERREQTLQRFSAFLDRRGELIAGIMMLLLGIALILFGISGLITNKVL